MGERFIRLDEVKRQTGLARATIYKYASMGEFPTPVRITGGASAWVESEVQGWIAATIAAARPAMAAQN